MALEPLVGLGPDLTVEEAERFSRHMLMPTIGQDGQRRLRAAKVCVVGAGGLGSPACLYLAAAGIGTIGIVDADVVDVTNLQRQIIHDSSSIGRAKTESAKARIEGYSPFTKVIEHQVRLTDDNASEIFSDYDLIVDGSDNFPTRYVVNDACEALGKPFIWASVFQTNAQVSVFWKRYPGGVDLRDLFPNPPSDVPTCSEAGVLGAMCGQVGALMATEAVKLICGIGDPLLGRVLVLDVLAATWREIRLRPSPKRRRRVDQPRPVFQESFTLVTPQQLAIALKNAKPPFVLDVREPNEVAMGVISGALTIPDRDIEAGILPSIAKHEQLVVTCKIGPRSLRAARILSQAGFINISLLQGGMIAWIDDIDPSLPRY